MAFLAAFKDPNRLILKATTKGSVTLKPKYLASLASYTKSPTVSLGRLASLLKRRTEHSHGVVALKALVIVHHLLCFGSENFLRYLSVTGCTFRRNPKMRLPADCTMGIFIEKYMEYLNVRLSSSGEILVDFCGEERSVLFSAVSVLRLDEAIRRIDVVQEQLCPLFLFSKASRNDFCSTIVLIAFSHLSEDLVILFKYQTVLIIRLLEQSSSLDRGYRDYRRDILQCYHEYQNTMVRIQDFESAADVIKKHIDFKKILADLSALEPRCDDSPMFRNRTRQRDESKSNRCPVINEPRLQWMGHASVFEDGSGNLMIFEESSQ